MGIVITSVVASSTRSVKNSLHARYQAESTRFGQELIEWIRSERDNNTWLVFAARGTAGGSVCSLPTIVPTGTPAPRPATTCQEYCIGDAPSWSACSSGVQGAISGTPYLRRAQVRTIDANTSEVIVVVAWTDGVGSHTSRVTTQLTSWNN
ncbi:MAG: hypothetical protein Q7S79_02115 [bacterium]|nr:hypothetical protein [bacterium]